MTEETIFAAALEKHDPAERRAYLDQACGDDAALHERVEALLHAHDQAGDFLKAPAAPGPAATKAADAAGWPQPAAPQIEPDDEEPDDELDFLQTATKPGTLGRLGHYEILKVIGKGGFGIVLKAFDALLHRVVAVKVMARQLAATSPARKRFLREARAAAAVRHENVVAIYNVEEQPIPYLVMEFIAGETLQQKLDRVGPLDAAEVVRIGRQIAEGLAEAHAKGLIHRDVKPANILLERGADRVKITDFGLARAADDASLTQSGVVAGTPMYMAPEQAKGETIDQRADLFSLGSVLYVMCSGRPPFRASSTMAVLMRVAEEPPRPIREIIPEVPEWLCALIAKLHAKKPRDRMASAHELADLLARCQQEMQKGDGVTALPQLTAPAAPDLPAEDSGPAPSSPAAKPRLIEKPRRRWLAPAAATVLIASLLLLVSVLAFMLRPSHGEPPVDPKAPVVFPVKANALWQDTGVDVVEGEAVVLSPQGMWRKGEQSCSAVGLDQAPRDWAVRPEMPLLCLLARIGEDPSTYSVRQREVFKPTHSGRLFVQANDVDLEENSDSLQLTITGGMRLGDAAPPPQLLPVQAAERDWKPLLARSNDSGANQERVRDAVFAYCQKYAGTPHAFRAGQLLLKLPPLVNSVGMKLAPIPPGRFVMGSPHSEDPERAPCEGPQHEVVVTRPFYLCVCDVTVDQFGQFVKETGYRTEAEKRGGAIRLVGGDWQVDPQASWRNPGFEQNGDHPVVCVAWTDAMAFCAWLSKKDGRKYGLPTEAQWEYACRAGSGTKFYFGDDEQELDQYAWYGANSQEHTHPVGQKKPNAWGLYDMHGNVFQWTADWFAEDYYQHSPKEDPPGPSTGGWRLMRGGGWYDRPVCCRDAWRLGGPPPWDCNAHVGFRVVLLP
ncbi:MAG TPA: bifunctional serine/threonine-protein kinase/formylglycine-generating enzyme family protein [Gemmataceae bacterium]|nr:bifunctional serine/threonine-protein kinase/formylglycine-generating enzyme family protein [Gemmataceae bacterium]